MNPERLWKKISHGLRPFAIETSGGNRYEIPHPEFVTVGRGVVVALGNDDSVNTIDALHIVSVEGLPRPGSRRAR